MMTAGSSTGRSYTEDRARGSAGISSETLYGLVTGVLEGKNCGIERIVDVGCGKGRLWTWVGERFGEYHGVDLIEYPEFPAKGRFHRADLNDAPIPLPDEFADVVVAVGTIEYLENPWQFVRELARVSRPGGWVLFSTPNQLSLLSKLTLLTKNRFNAFQRQAPDAALTCLLPADLHRMARSAGLTEVSVIFTDRGRVPFTARHWPRVFKGQAFSDAVMCVGRKPVTRE